MNSIARQSKLRVAQAALLAFVVSLGMIAQASAQSAQADKFPNVKIKNFGQMDERFYRGAQPKENDYKALAELGINTIIDLRNDPLEYEKRIAESLGMRYVNIPMSDKKYPKQEQIDEFINLVKDQATGKFYVHCAGGRHRTGVMGAAYRYNFYQWNYDQVYKEMKAFDYYSRWGHGALKEYVQDYYEKIQTAGVNATTDAATQSNR